MPSAICHSKTFIRTRSPAEAAKCAHEQGKLWEMHERLFANQMR